VLEVEDRDAEASQVVPLLDDQWHVVTGDAEPDQSRTLGSCLPPVPVALKLLEALGASDRVVAGSCATLATVGAAAGVDPSGVESVVNSPMSAPPDRLPFSRVERRARRSTGSQRQAVAAVVNYGGAAAVDTVFIDEMKKRGRARRRRLRPARPRG
jgi:hypothetical protein